MPFFSTQFNSFGLDISDSYLKLAEIKKNIKGTYLNAWGIKKIEPGIIQKGEIKNHNKLAEEIKKVFASARGKITTNLVAACLPNEKTFIKLLTFKKIRNIDEQSLKNLIESDLPNHIPIETENLRYDYQIISQNENFLKVLIAATDKKTREEHELVLKKAGLEIVALETEAQAITRAIFKEGLIQAHIKNNLFKIKKVGLESHHEPHIIIDLGSSRSSLIYWDFETIQFTSDLDISGNEITQKISQKIKIPQDKAEKAKIICGLNIKKGKGEIYEIILSETDKLFNEINQSKDYYLKYDGQNHRQVKVILSGGLAEMINLKETLAKRLNMPVIKANPLVNIKFNQAFLPKKYQTTFTIAIGLALRHTLFEDI